MTAKHRNKNKTNEKNFEINRDDVAMAASKGGENIGSGSGSRVNVLAALCYVTLVVAAGLAAFYLKLVLEEISQISRRTDGSIQKNAELVRRMESVLHQVDSLRRTVDGFQPAISSMQAELVGLGRALIKGEVEARQAEGSLGRAVEWRLGELARSVGERVAQLTEAQADARVQIGDLEARLDGIMDLAPLRQELLAIAPAVAELHTANQGAETTAESLREQMGALGAELQTRNQEVASVAQEMESVRALVWNTVEELEKSVSTVEISVQALSHQALSLQAGLEQAAGSIRSVEKALQGTAAGVEKCGEEVGAQLRTVEENIDALRASEVDRAAALDSLFSRSNSQDKALASLDREMQSAHLAGKVEVMGLLAQLTEAGQAHQALGGQVEALQSGLGELWSVAAILNSTQTEQSSCDSSLTLQLEWLGQKLTTLGEAVREAQASHLKALLGQAGLQQLRTTVDGLLSFSNKVKGHVDAIASLKSALEETNASVSAMSKKQKVLGKDV